jgi:hypothetical protein
LYRHEEKCCWVFRRAEIPRWGSPRRFRRYHWDAASLALDARPVQAQKALVCWARERPVFSEPRQILGS